MTKGSTNLNHCVKCRHCYSGDMLCYFADKYMCAKTCTACACKWVEIQDYIGQIIDEMICPYCEELTKFTDPTPKKAELGSSKCLRCSKVFAIYWLNERQVYQI